MESPTIDRPESRVGSIPLSPTYSEEELLEGGISSLSLDEKCGNDEKYIAPRHTGHHWSPKLLLRYVYRNGDLRCGVD